MTSTAVTRKVLLRRNLRKITLAGESGEEYIIKLIKITGRRFKFEYKGYVITIYNEEKPWLVCDRVGRAVPGRFEPSMYKAVHWFALLIMKAVQAGYGGHSVTEDAVQFGQMNFFDQS